MCVYLIKLAYGMFMFCLMSNSVYSQDLREIKRRAAQLGVSPMEIDNAIKSLNESGSQSEVEGLRDNLESIESKEPIQSREAILKEIESINSQNTTNNDLTLRNVDEVGKSDIVANSNLDSFSSNNDVSAKKSQGYFGYDIFYKNPELFNNTLKDYIDPEHVIGPGDEIIIMLWGATEQLNKYIVARDGYIFVENVGQIFVNGLTLSKLEEKLLKILKKAYATLGNNYSDQSTFFDISLGSFSIRPTRIHVVGNIRQPGAYSMSSSTTLFSSLFYFNGPSLDGTLRDIRLLRAGEIVSKLDFYEYLMSGKKGSDIKLETDDVVYIPNRYKTVIVEGEINRPSIYELKENEGLKKLIYYCGGLKSTTYHKRVQIERIVPIEERLINNDERIVIDIDFKELINNDDDYPLEDGDKILFYKINDKKNNYVVLNGAVNRPGTYGFSKGLSISDLIKKADGLVGDAYRKRVDVIRTNFDFSQTQYDFDFEDVMSDPKNSKYLLESLDEVTVHKKSEMEFKDDINISGHVLFPQDIPFRENMQLYDVVFLGGGFENDDHLKKTYMKRADLFRVNKNNFKRYNIPFRLDSLLEGNGKAKMVMEMGDEVKIYSILDIEGEKEKFYSVDGYVKNQEKIGFLTTCAFSMLYFLVGELRIRLMFLVFLWPGLI